MKIYNYWIIKFQEQNILKVIEWAHRNKIKVENLTTQNIFDALETYLRDSSHSY